MPHTVIWECLADGCGLQFAFPQLDEADLAAAYKTHYYSSTEESHPVKYDSAPVLRQVLPQLEASFGSLEGLRLLDYGWGRGPLSRIAYELGIAAPVGIEPDPVARSSTAACLAVAVYANLDELRSHEPTAQFDLIILWNVIEHLRQPWSELREVREFLCPSGRLLVCTMNVECLRARIERRRWMNYQDPTHLYYFNRGSLERVIASAGFRGVHEWKPKIRYPHHGTMRRWLYETSSLFGVSDGLYFLCSVERDVLSPSQVNGSQIEATVHAHVDASA